MSNYEKEVTKFLLQPENFACALEIADYVLTMRNSLQDDFWREVELHLNNELAKSQSKEEWSVDKNNAGITLAWKSSKNNSLGLRLEQQGDSLCYGCYWYNGMSKQPNKIDFSLLRTTLKDRGVTKTSTPNWWLVWEWTNYSSESGLRSKKTLIELAKGDKHISHEMGSLLWGLFSETVDELEKINQELATIHND